MLVLAPLLYRISRHGRLGLAFLAVTTVLAAAWLLAKLAVRVDYRDADGYVNCWPGCRLLQEAVGWAIWYGPLLFIALGALRRAPVGGRYPLRRRRPHRTA